VTTVSPPAPGLSLDERLRALLDQDTVVSQLRAGPLSYVDPDVAEKVLVVCESQRRSLLAAADDVPDIDELAYLLACRYVEDKASRIQANLRIQYRSMMGAASDAELVAFAGCVSSLLSRIEPLIDTTQVQRINELMLTPL